ncbi:ROK family protein [Microterricola viridarii]|uniref:Glucokinase n=1 Tax=Microterricola viridarii TaxID=412690 RepID=A0A0Y0N225_9MICO|nr:ROK family protein [Microterricola viridarii]AMB58002.1 hypothetical protein AWU67_02965 [Microterricola viridarii]
MIPEHTHATHDDGLVLSLDIGGTKIAAGLVTAAGSVVARAETATPAREGGERILATAAALGTEVLGSLGSARLVAVSVGSAGVIEADTGRVLAATGHLSDWKGTEICRGLAASFTVPILACNDVHAHAVGETFVGAGRGHGTVLVGAVGTGIGGAVVIDGVPQFGTHGVAGHLGHVPVHEAEGVLCPCGRYGHVEAISSGTALHALYLRNGGDPAARDTRDVVSRAAHDTVAFDTVVTSAGAFGRALAGVINMIDPGIVVLAGGMINAGALWWDSMLAGAREGTMPILSDVPIVRAQLGNDAALIGAAKRAFDAQGDHA